ncbi:MAG TPA: flavodoxin domain-containing protein [Terracidiphilus sp.]|jgi:menaquinone-dependent protoporphyrinogen oxidase
MEHLVLVAYATKYGSTEETARIVAAVLHANGLPVDVCAVNDVRGFVHYSAVVLCGALYMGRLHRNARRFLLAWREQLSRIPVALLVAGPVNMDPKDWAGAEQQLNKELARLDPWFLPIDQKIVGGKWDPAKLRFPLSLILRKIPANDARDWAAIRAWANNLAGKLQPAWAT